MQLLFNRSIKTCLALLLSLLLLSCGLLPLHAASNEIYVTAYNDNGIMANGQRTYLGAIACPRWMRLGQFIIIHSLGTFVCADRYASFLSDRFDISMPAATVRDCYAITGWYQWTPIIE